MHPPRPIVEPRGPLSEWLLAHLAQPVHGLPDPPPATAASSKAEDDSLSLYLCYELHYRGLPGVDDGWEWEPTLLDVRRRLERAFLASIVSEIGVPRTDMPATTMRDQLVELAGADDGPSVSAHMEVDGTVDQMREFCVHRSLYQLKEADPHTFAIPRLHGPAKAAMVAIQVGEYGDGRPARVHSHLFARTMEQLGLDPTYGAYLSAVPATTLDTVNLVSMFGLHRRWRGAVVGHLALFEMCSVGPMGRYASALRRFGLGPTATEFYDAHVVADELHQVIALEQMATGLARTEPELAGSVVFGARAVKFLERRLATHLLDSWDHRVTSLRVPLPPWRDHAVPALSAV